MVFFTVGLFFWKVNIMKKSSQKSLVQVATIAMLTAISFVLFLLEFPLFAALGHLKTDLSDIPALFAGIVYGPGAAVIIELLKNVIELIFKGIGTQMGFGNLMNFIVGCAYVVPFSILFRSLKKKSEKKGEYNSKKENKYILLSSLLGVAAIVFIGFFANYLVTPLFFKYFLGIELDGATLWAAIGSSATLNAIKGAMLSVVSFPIIKVLVERLKKFVY